MKSQCPDGQPPRDSGFAHDHKEPDPMSSPPLDMKSSGGRPPSPVFPYDNKEIVTTPYSANMDHFCTVNSHIHHERFDELLKLIDIDGQRQKPVNLMNDPVLNVVISAKKTQLAVKLIKRVKSVMPLWEKNIYGDTALHVAAVEGNIIVAEALLHREPQLVKAVNKKGETAIHKAAIYGREDMFWCLVYEGSEESYLYGNYDGSNVLHCAIMGNNPKLALHIAKTFLNPNLILSRDEAALTPLQLIVTIPNFLRSPLVRGPLNSFLYRLISPEVEKRFPPKNVIANKEDEEAGRPVDLERDEESYGWACKSVRSKFRSPYTIILYLTKLIASWVRSGVLVIFKQVYRTVNDLEKEKERYMAAMKLVELLAERTYFDFYGKGYWGEPNPTVFDAMGIHSNLQYPERLPRRWMESSPIIAADWHRLPSGWMVQPPFIETERLPIRWMESSPVTVADRHRLPSGWMVQPPFIEAERLPSRWMEPPLIIAAELGLDDFVGKILQVCPHSAIYLDSKGRNVMQVAIQSGHKKVVKVISEMLEGSNPVLPSCLRSMLDRKSRNTILHLAAENSPGEANALQLHHELVWFEMVEKIIPKELVYSRNNQGKTAHELFTNRHKETLENCKRQLVDIGRTCAGLVATVVLTSSFSFPSEKDNESGSFAFKIVSHAYMIGFGCAATALVLFLLLVLRPYKERDFRWVIPWQLFFACLYFALALGAFYLTVVCNIILQIYDSKMNKKHLIPLILELVLYPVVCFYVLVDRVVKFSPS